MDTEREHPPPSTEAGMMSRAAIPQRLDQLEEALNETAKRAVAALSEAAMARQEVAAQSARIDRAIGSGESVAADIRKALYEVETVHQRRLEALEAGIMHTQETAAHQDWVTGLEDRLDRLEKAVSQMPAPRLSVSNVQEQNMPEMLRHIADTSNLGKGDKDWLRAAARVIEAVNFRG